MPNPRAFLLPAVLAFLAACGADEQRYLVTSPAPQVRVSTAAATIMLRQVSLPDYAAAETIALQEGGGAVREIRGALWADLPQRALTLALARQLDAAVSATVAAEPWPLAGLPDAEIEVRVERNLAGADGQFRLGGVYYVLSEVGRLGPRSAPFDIAVPLAGTAPGEIAQAQALALTRLAETIASGIGR